MTALTGVLIGLASVVAPLCTAPAAAARSQAMTVTVHTAGGMLLIRSGPAVYSAPLDALANGARVTVSCAVRGQLITGTRGTTRQWDRLPTGRYISHAYVDGAAVPVCPDPPPPNGSMTPAQFIAAAAPLAQQGRREFDVPASVTLAQAILESGWGRSQLSANDRSYFGIKCFGWPGSIAVSCHTYPTSECDAAGHCQPTDASFRAYASVADSFRDHGLFLRANDRYRAAFDHTGNADQFLLQICQAGYATSPTYYTSLSGLMHQYNLYQYDQG
jgi:flagellar protein FlgJ